jgi:hypothetical protein
MFKTLYFVMAISSLTLLSTPQNAEAGRRGRSRGCGCCQHDTYSAPHHQDDAPPSHYDDDLPAAPTPDESTMNPSQRRYSYEPQVEQGTRRYSYEPSGRSSSTRTSRPNSQYRLPKSDPRFYSF